MDEVKRLRNGDYVYAFIRDEIKRQTVWQYKILPT